METPGKTIISVQTVVDASIEDVWKFWTTPEHIMRWNNASDDWHTTKAENDLREGGNFSYRMEAKDGSMGFDFGGVYDNILLFKEIKLTLGDDRKVKIVFNSLGSKTEIIESFEAENTNSIDLQRNGWQSIMNNFKKYAEHF